MTRATFRQEAWIGCGHRVPSLRFSHRGPDTIYHVVDPQEDFNELVARHAPRVHRSEPPCRPPPTDTGPEVVRSYTCDVQAAGLAPDSMDAVRAFNVPMGDAPKSEGLPESVLETAIRILKPGGHLYLGEWNTPWGFEPSLAAVAQRLGATVPEWSWEHSNAVEAWRAVSQALGFRFRVLVPHIDELTLKEPHRLSHRARCLMAVNFGSSFYELSMASPETYLIRMQKPQTPSP